MEDKWDIVEFAQWLSFIYGIGGIYFNSVSMVIWAFIMMAVVTSIGLRYGEKRLEAFKEKEA